MTRALGTKEHGGRVRGVEGRAQIKEVFVSGKRKQSGVVSIDELAKITKEITKKVQKECDKKMNEKINEMMNVKLQGIFDHLKQMGVPLLSDRFVFEEIGTLKNKLVRSSFQFVDRQDNFLNLKVFFMYLSTFYHYL